ncbi:MAG TPA: NAD(P)-binding domain-containing protein [Ramlibacter sp.]|uniref:ornithine cyclodeaminase family protein n=1 Tax=Ramlibacter sp. TaxID=1917967 RepID=UPI002B63A583|nr:NAD(P)-binding domain-containing protein [Ramlibacter sp.]HVZ45191.1 NAD(P)-binding domain-containing protein [Ramlibacter sp.]
MAADRALLHLTDADVRALGLDARAVREAVRDAFLSYSSGTIRCEAKTVLGLGEGHSFQSLSAADTQRRCAVLKWVGVVPPGAGETTNIHASMLLSDADTGRVLCLMDARRATAWRTAAMSALAAQHLARAESTVIGFVGAGTQAGNHLAALLEVLPNLKAVRATSATGRSAERLVRQAREFGLDASVCGAQEAVSGSDVVVTTVPLRAGFAPFIDAAWLRAGGFAAAVDLGRSWKRDGLASMDVTAVDESALRHYGKPGGLVPSLEHAEATLVDLVAGRHPGRGGARERTMFFSSGSAVADLAVAMLIHERALAHGAGTWLAD